MSAEEILGVLADESKTTSTALAGKFNCDHQKVMVLLLIKIARMGIGHLYVILIFVQSSDDLNHYVAL